MIEVDDIRNPQIAFHGLTGADRVYTLYHDETNNVRKLRVGADGLNVVELAVFVLGGVVHDGPARDFDIEGLRAAMRIQASAPEIKFKHVAPGEFPRLLNSTKLTTFLRWIADAGLTVQYHDLDPLHWAIVDIIDLVFEKRADIRGLWPMHRDLKSDLCLALRANLAETLMLFHRHGFPGLAPDQARPFFEALIDIVMRDEDLLPHIRMMMLKGVLQAGRSLDTLVEGDPRNVLIDGFSHFYMNRIAVFKHSAHVLDAEPEIQDAFLREPLVDRGRPVANYRFADSRSEPGIQVADIVVGLLGKMHSWLAATPREDVAEARDSLVGASLENVRLVRDAISAAHDANIAFLHHAVSGHDQDKLDLFLRFHDGRYAE